MPYRPIQHQISAKAVVKVCDVWTDIGTAVEEIQRDYGEDLLVQTCLNGKMDSSRIWVQVKGVQRAPGMRKPRGKAQVRIRADLALRWARTADILVLVLWDVESSVGWYSIPELADLHSELAEKGRRNISLTILSKNLFDADAARHIAWEGRLAHLARFVRNFRRLQEEEAQIEPGEHRWADEAISEAVVDMMVDLGILGKVTVKRREVVPSREFRKFFLDMARDTRGAQPASAEEIDEYFKEISFASYFMWISDVIGCAISASLMSEMVPIVDYFFNPESPRDSLGHLSYGRRSI